jgi:hypothetical protein
MFLVVDNGGMEDMSWTMVRDSFLAIFTDIGGKTKGNG